MHLWRSRQREPKKKQFAAEFALAADGRAGGQERGLSWVTEVRKANAWSWHSLGPRNVPEHPTARDIALIIAVCIFNVEIWFDFLHLFVCICRSQSAIYWSCAQCSKKSKYIFACPLIPFGKLAGAHILNINQATYVRHAKTTTPSRSPSLSVSLSKSLPTQVVCLCCVFVCVCCWKSTT